MPRYSLVASYYDINERNPKLRYKNEIEINIPGRDLSTLQSIDEFTAGLTQTEIFLVLKKILGIYDKNQLAVKYKKSKTAEPKYYKIIENNKNFIPCTKITQSETIWIDGQHRTILPVPRSSELFQRELAELLEIIENKDLGYFEQKYPYDDELKLYVTRYINTYYEEEYSQRENLEIIKKEFSNYRTFRKWILAADLRIYHRENYLEKKKYVIKEEDKSKIKKILKSVKEIADEYEKEFNKNEENKNNGITYKQQTINKYNTSYLDEDKEEFLEEDEYAFLDDEVEGNNFGYNKKIKK